ncbi:helix-turn-helix domain-containing protein [Bifidobacterium cuniculi]|uniref:HTH cro/C1-type domain-containing protein n=1 Tax=Bifidobacterium cuniculi TaxID=1688 RepID=A0A087ADJ2_9BIFI|nr:helix-turn-helix transcriptional regulator [Bifidobacterium cuniculi]KFI56842.1 hypothetical protein BCUN_2164 [Bifidobacterium cuniculi]
MVDINECKRIWDERLMQCYKNRDYTQRTLAEALTARHPERPVTQAMISHWCHLSDTGRDFPKYQTMLEIAEVLETSVAYLTGEIDANNMKEEEVCDYTGLLPQAVRSLRLATQREDDPCVNLNEGINSCAIEELEGFDNPSLPLGKRIRTIPRYLSDEYNARTRSVTVSRFLATSAFRNELTKALEQLLNTYTSAYDTTDSERDGMRFFRAKRHATEARYQANEALIRIMDEMTSDAKLPGIEIIAKRMKEIDTARAFSVLADATRVMEKHMNELRASAHHDSARYTIPVTVNSSDPFGLHHSKSEEGNTGLEIQE